MTRLARSFLALTIGALVSVPMGTARAEQKVMTVRLTKGDGVGAQRTYEAEVLDGTGNLIPNATLDIGGLADNPDLRVPTIAMKATVADPNHYRATVTFPADGDWVLVVRVHKPTQAVELFTEAITGTGQTGNAGHANPSPSRRAVINADPTFFDRYSPGGVKTGLEAGTSVAHSGAAVDQTDEAFSIGTPIIALVHSFGALAWIVAVLGLVLANRIGSGAARTEITKFIARRYRLLAGGGLVAVVLTGPYMVIEASAGLNHPTELLQSNLGTAYLAIFACKLVLVGGSLLTTWRIQKCLPTTEQFRKHGALASVGSMANDDMSAYHPTTARAFRLAEANAQIGAVILGCVVLLGQLHHVLP
jgi:hypothetical protein